MRHVFATLGTSAALLAMAGCPDRTISKLDPQQQGETTKDIPVSTDIDILFVIDNSASTQDKQTAFLTNFTNFVTALDAFPTGRPNIHLGVVSSTVKIGSQDVTSFGTACVNAPGDNGLLHNTPSGMPAGCTAPNGQFISDIAVPGSNPPMRQTNYSGTLQDTFSCIADLGTAGCGFEAQLQGMKLALDGSNPENTGFLRDGAFLAIVILTDEDDASVKDPSVFNLPTSQVGPGDFRLQPLYAYGCDTAISATTPGTYNDCKPLTGVNDMYLQDTDYYASFLSSIKDPSQLVVALIAGGQQDGSPPASTIMTGPLTIGTSSQSMALQPSCTATINGNPAIARPGIRLYDFVSQFGDHGLYQTVCTDDYSPALTAIGQLLFKTVSPCLEGNIDTTDADPNNPGTQLQCTVSEVNDTAMTDTVLPACMMQDANTPVAGQNPCWYVVTDATGCATTPSQLTLKTLPAMMDLPTGTSTDISCAVMATGSN